MRLSIAPSAIKRNSSREDERFIMRSFSSIDDTPDACINNNSRDDTVVSIKDNSCIALSRTSSAMVFALDFSSRSVFRLSSLILAFSSSALL